MRIYTMKTTQNSPKRGRKITRKAKNLQKSVLSEDRISLFEKEMDHKWGFYGPPATCAKLYMERSSRLERIYRNGVPFSNLMRRFRQKGSFTSLTGEYNALNDEVSKHFRVFMIPFTAGEETPKITLDATGNIATLKWADQTDTVQFSVGGDNRSRFSIARNGTEIVHVQ